MLIAEDGRIIKSTTDNFADGLWSRDVFQPTYYHRLDDGWTPLVPGSAREQGITRDRQVEGAVARFEWGKS